MKPLGDTILALSRLRKTLPPAITARHLVALNDFGANPGALSGWLHLPTNLKAGAALVVVLHGCTQSAAGYDYGSGWSALADQHGFALLFAEQSRINNPNLCFNWFSPGDIRRGSGEVESIREMIAAAIATHQLDAGRVYITGLSAGGAMAASMLASHPELFAAGAIIAGLPHGVAGNVSQALERMRGQGLPGANQLEALLSDAAPQNGHKPRLSVWQGSADAVVAASNAEAIVNQWRGVHRLGDAPDERETIDGARRRIWRDNAGDIVVESWEITGMGHGIPIAPDSDGLGHPMPYMLDAGISSTAHIAAFFELTEARKPARARPEASPEARSTEAGEDQPVTVESKAMTPRRQATADFAESTINLLPKPPVEVAVVEAVTELKAQDAPASAPLARHPVGVGEVGAYVQGVLDASLPKQHAGLGAKIRDIIDGAMKKAGLR